MSEMLTIQLVGTTRFRQVSAKNWNRWPKANEMDPREFRSGSGNDIWQLVSADALAKAKAVEAEPRKPIKIPSDIKLGPVVEEQEPEVEQELEEVAEGEEPKAKRKYQRRQ